MAARNPMLGRMLKAIAGLLERAWLHVVAGFAAIALALSPLYVGALRHWGAHNGWDDWLAGLVLGAVGLLSVAGVGLGVWRYEVRGREVEADLMVALRASLIPVADRFIQLRRPVATDALEDAMTELAARCALFARKDDDQPDANVYRLEGQRLLRINRSAGTARPQFAKTRGKKPEAIEESAVVDRVMGCQVTICEDVKDPDKRTTLKLADIDRNYRSFISVPIVRGDGTPYGMISLNSTKKNGLRAVHLNYLQNLAVLIAALEGVQATSITPIVGSVVQNRTEEAS